MISEKFVILIFLAVAAPLATATFGLPHSNLVTALCALAQDKTECAKVLDPINTDDPKELAVDSFLACEGPMKSYINFLNNLKAKYKDDVVYIETCEGRIKNAFEDIATFKEKAGTDFSTFARNYASLKELTNSVYVALSGCTADVENTKLLDDLNAGMAEVSKIASNAVDIFANLEPTLKQLGINVKLN